jgi:hypothetical protein
MWGFRWAHSTPPAITHASMPHRAIIVRVRSTASLLGSAIRYQERPGGLAMLYLGRGPPASLRTSSFHMLFMMSWLEPAMSVSIFGSSRRSKSKALDPSFLANMT